ncbi:serine/threonine-protein phosphatase PGAM5, mitochondrial-like isoform X3 [Artemia franciscana]|uniref:serine/threonine-protein phosphatase PGAM5, mitochondrial-like isoform X3 n=1 Tax=Artemia franciscana TaxID=6661 RepID=UPI0032D9ED87
MRVQHLKYGLCGIAGAVAAYVYQQTEESFRKNIPFRVSAFAGAKTTNQSFSAEEASPSVKWDFNWDRRDPKFLVKPKKNETDDDLANRIMEVKPKASRHLFLIRHGQYVVGPTDEERFLTPLGREQAKLTGQRLKELGFDYNLVLRSTMTRATETAMIIQDVLGETKTKSCDLIREGAPIKPEPPVSHWKPEVYFYQDGARIEAAFRKYFHRADATQEYDTYEVIVCHANVIRYCVCRALQLPPEAWLRISLHNGSITWLEIKPSGNVVLRGLGDVGHMPRNKMSTS